MECVPPIIQTVCHQIAGRESTCDCTLFKKLIKTNKMVVLKSLLYYVCMVLKLRISVATVLYLVEEEVHGEK